MNRRINLFEYDEYRTFLRDWYQESKKVMRSYSYRAFAKKAGFHTSNFLMLVIQGKRNLTEESLKRVVTGLGLNKQEQDFFRNLVFFNQAKTPQDKNSYYRGLLQSKKFNQLKPIEKKQFEYCSAWYHPVVRELVVSPGFDGTPESIASRLFPPVTPAQVAKSIQLLENLGFITKNGGDRWQQASTLVSTGPELTSFVVHNYHKLLLDLSKEVMDTISTKHRDVSAVTLGVRRERIPQIRQKVRQFRQEILKMVSEDTQPEEVMQLNIQLFPVTRIVD